MTDKKEEPVAPVESEFYDGPEALEATEDSADFDAEETNAKEVAPE